MKNKNINPNFTSEVQEIVRWQMPTADDSSISGDLVAWNKMKILLDQV